MDATQLDAIPLFAGLTLDQRASVAGSCEELAAEAGSTLVQEGDFGYGMFAITSGMADVIIDGAVVRTLGPGDMFGEIAVLSGGRRTATVIAATDDDANHGPEPGPVASRARVARDRHRSACDDRRAPRHIGRIAARPA